MKRLITHAVTAAALLVSLASLTAPAVAVPDTGASGDTPGTTATVTTRSLPVGGTLGFRVTGFPAGEVVYVKIDDGKFCSASATHGACVVHQQRLDAHGAASGSFVLPGDVAVGKHWLRFLASQQVAGDGGGVKGYTARGSTDFTVTAPSTRASSPASTSTSTDNPDGTGTTASTPEDGASTSALSADAATVPSAGATLTLDLPSAGATVTVTATPSAVPAAGSMAAQAADSAASVGPAAAAGTSKHAPYVGIGGLLLLVALAGVLLVRRLGRSGA